MYARRVYLIYIYLPSEASWVFFPLFFFNEVSVLPLKSRGWVAEPQPSPTGILLFLIEAVISADKRRT